MAITSLDILNLSHSLKDICEVNCNTPECLTQTLKILMQYNLIQANLQFSRQFGLPCAPAACPPAAAMSAPAIPPSPRRAPALFGPDGASKAPDASASAPAAHGSAGTPKAPYVSPPLQDADSTPQRPPIRLDIGDPFLADYEK